MTLPQKPSAMERLKALGRKLLALDDTPHRIAFGVAIGFFVAFLPIVGIQMAASALLSRLLGASVPASLPWAWITNPITIPPIFYGTYRLGAVFTGGEVTYERMAGVWGSVDELGFWRGAVKGYELLLDLYWPMVVGGAIVGLIFGAASYFVALALVNRARRRSAQAPET